MTHYTLLAQITDLGPTPILTGAGRGRPVMDALLVLIVFGVLVLVLPVRPEDCE